MLIKEKIYQPIILTIPEDAAFFSILDPSNKIAAKIIMENYIDFFCFKDIYNLVYFRFKNSTDYGNIEGIKQCFIPMELVKSHFNDLNIIVQLLLDGYVLSMPVDRKSIDFYRNSTGTHILLIYGVDTAQQILFCKDFSYHMFVEFEVSFESMKKSIANCDITNLRASDGLLAFRINNKIDPSIEYSKVYSEFHKLRSEYTSANAGYGLGAIELYVNGVIQYPCEVSPIDRWYVIANYLREFANLMKIRFDILENAICEKQIKKDLDTLLIKNLIDDTDLLFFTILKLQKKGIISSPEIIDKLYFLTNICKKDITMLAKYMCEFISNTISLD